MRLLRMVYLQAQSKTQARQVPNLCFLKAKEDYRLTMKRLYEIEIYELLKYRYFKIYKLDKIIF